MSAAGVVIGWMRAHRMMPDRRSRPRDGRRPSVRQAVAQVREAGSEVQAATTKLRETVR